MGLIKCFEDADVDWLSDILIFLSLEVVFFDLNP